MHRTKLDRIRHANLTGKNSIQGKRFFFADCGSEHIRRARCGKSARRDLSGGRWVTGVPTATIRPIFFITAGKTKLKPTLIDTSKNHN